MQLCDVGHGLLIFLKLILVSVHFTCTGYIEIVIDIKKLLHMLNFNLD